MAEAAPLVAGLCACLGVEVGHSVNLDDRLEKLSEQLSELEHLKRDIQEDVIQAPRANREPTEVAKGWLERADSIISHAKAAMEKAEEKKKKHKQASDGRRYCAHSWSRYKLGKSIAKVTKKVTRHLEKAKQLKILRDTQPDMAANKEQATEGDSATTAPQSTGGEANKL